MSLAGFKFFYVTLQASDGGREEYRCERAVAKAVKLGEIGVGCVQVGRLLACRGSRWCGESRRGAW